MCHMLPSGDLWCEVKFSFEPILDIQRCNLPALIIREERTFGATEEACERVGAISDQVT